MTQIFAYLGPSFFVSICTRIIDGNVCKVVMEEKASHATPPRPHLFPHLAGRGVLDEEGVVAC